MKVTITKRFKKDNGKYWEEGQEVDVAGELLERVLKNNKKEEKLSKFDKSENEKEVKHKIEE